MAREHPDHSRRLYGEISAVPYDDTHPLLERVDKLTREGYGNLFANGSDYPAVTPYQLVRNTLEGLRRAAWPTLFP